MNYKSQLKGWAVDRVIEMYKAGGVQPSLKTVMAEAEELAAYAYVESEALEDCAKTLFDLVRNAPAGEAKIDALLGTLEHIKADRIGQGIDKAPEEETVQ